MQATKGTAGERGWNYETGHFERFRRRTLRLAPFGRLLERNISGNRPVPVLSLDGVTWADGLARDEARVCTHAERRAAAGALRSSLPAPLVNILAPAAVIGAMNYAANYLSQQVLGHANGVLNLAATAAGLVLYAVGRFCISTSVFAEERTRRLMKLKPFIPENEQK